VLLILLAGGFVVKIKHVPPGCSLIVWTSENRELVVFVGVSGLSD